MNYRSKYVVFPEKQQVAVWEEDITPPEAGEILCQAEKSLISIGTELHCLHGEFDPGTNWFDWVKYPFRPGYSMVGRVLAVGRGVTEAREGDRIVSYDQHQQVYKLTFGKRPDAPEGIKPCLLPEGISGEDATWRSLAGTTQNAVRRAQFQFGETAVVIGLGILGQLVTQYLAVAGARKIMVIDPVVSRLELAKQHGATHTLQMNAQEAAEPVRELTGGWMADVCFDVTGHPAVLAPAIRLVRRLGRVVLLGDTPRPTQQFLGPGALSNSVAILGIHGYQVPDKTSEYAPWSVETMTSLFFDYLLSGRMKVSDLVTNRYSPLQAPEVYQGLVNNRAQDVGVIFDWSKLG